MRASTLLAAAAALGSSGCGLLIDGAYLLSGKTYQESVEQRRPTAEAETKPEVRLVFEGPRVSVACEDVTRGIDRVWMVNKTFERQGGFYRAHWAPVVIEGIVGGIFAIAIGARCADPTSKISCDLLYGTIPLGVDVAYSMIRALTIDRPKLVDKTYGTPYPQPRAEPSARGVAACSPRTLVRAYSRDQQLELPVPPNGELALADQQRLIALVARYKDARVWVGADEGVRGDERGRCEFLRALTPMPTGGGDCIPTPR